MKTMLEKDTRDELINRINSLNETSKPQWGKMNAWQMIRHCVIVEEMFLNDKEYPRSFLGRLIGQMAIKNMLKDERPIERNAPTGHDFKIVDISGDVDLEKTKWIALIEAYGNYSRPFYVHWFFGKMTKEQVGYFAYKHVDHHLRQFNS